MDCNELKFSFSASALLNYQIIRFSYCVLLIATISTNIAVLFAFYKLSFHKTTHHRLLVLLLLMDLLTSVAIHPLQIYRYHFYAKKENSCTVLVWMSFLSNTLMFMSLSIIILISGDQYFKIVRPFYRFPLSGKTISLLLSVLWVTSTAVAFLAYIVFPQLLNIFFTITGIFVMILYFGLCFTQYRINRECVFMVVRGNQDDDTRLRLRSARMSKSILIAFSFSFLPTAIVSSVVRGLSLGNGVVMDTYLLPWSTFILFLNPLIDPMIYCFRLKSVRNFLFATLCGRIKPNRVTAS